jgi:multidrug resistance efflux pump
VSDNYGEWIDVSEARTKGAYTDIWKRVAIIATAFALLGAVSYAVSYFQHQSTLDKGYLEVAANVRAQTYTVRAPAIIAPTIDATVGFAKATTTTAKKPDTASRTVLTNLITEVFVAEGDTVVAGQELARFDSALLDLAVKQAETAAAKSRTDIDVLADALGTISSNQADIAKAKRDLLASLAEAKTQRADLAAQLKQLESMPTPPPGSVLPTGTPNPAELIPQLKAGLAQIDAGIAKMESGLRTMASGSTKLSDAKTQATNGRELLVLVADARDVATELAKARRDSAVITAPVDGLVTFARRAGSTAMVNAPLFRISPDTATLIDTYLTAAQLARVSVGDAAEVTYDSGADLVMHGRVTGIGITSAFPPTTFSTDVVHMTRTTRVTITLEGGAKPPAGTPVDLTIRTDSRN